MLEVTVHRVDGGLASFQFENDALQAFLTNDFSGDLTFTVTELRVLGPVPVTARGGVPAPKRDARPQQHPDARQIPSDRDTLGIRTPIQETARAKAEADAAAQAVRVSVKPADIDPDGGTASPKSGKPEKK